MTRAEILDCLTDRPCDYCKFHESGRCERWNCVFEEKPDDAEDCEDNGMKEISDTLTVGFDSSLDGEAGICIARVTNGKITVLKMEIGEQADILYHLLTEQTTKAEIKAESEVSE